MQVINFYLHSTDSSIMEIVLFAAQHTANALSVHAVCRIVIVMLSSRKDHFQLCWNVTLDSGVVPHREFRS